MARTRQLQQGQERGAAMRKYINVALLMLGLGLGSARPALAEIYFFQQIDVPGGTDVFATGINDSGTIVGYFTDVDGRERGFLLSGGGPSPYTVSGSRHTELWKINNSGAMVGVFSDTNGTHGFLRSGGGVTTIDVHPAVSTFAYGVNNANKVVGTSLDLNYRHQGYLWNGAFTKLSPGLVTGINDGGWMVGIDPGGESILWAATNTRTFIIPFMFSGSNRTEAYDINNVNSIVGFFENSRPHGFLTRARGHSAVDPPLQIDVPGSVMTIAYGVNNANEIVGGFSRNGVTHYGFLARPLHTRTPTHINLGNSIPSQQTTHVTFFSTADFDATSILPDTVRFGVLDIPGPVPSGATPVQVDVEDVNHDDTLDLVLFFDPQDTGLQCSDTTASLIGQLDDGQVFGGAEKVKVKCEQ
jgi:probable HAF family extracellular repeat protein